jgi:Tripartite tricarboxylate transporter family receptor
MSPSPAAEPHWEDPNQIIPSEASASGGGCCRSVGILPGRVVTSLSRASGALNRRLSAWRHCRHSGTPDGTMVVERLGQPFTIESRPGACTIVATEAVVKAAPDGYTLLLATEAAVLPSGHNRCTAFCPTTRLFWTVCEAPPFGGVEIFSGAPVGRKGSSQPRHADASRPRLKHSVSMRLSMAECYLYAICRRGRA